MEIQDSRIRIFNTSLDFLYETSLYSNIRFEREFYKSGQMLLRIKPNGSDSFFKANNIISVGTHDDTLYVIQEVIRDISSEFGETFLITANDMKSIFDNRLCVPPVGKSNSEINGNCKDIVYKLLDENIINPVDPIRKIPVFNLLTPTYTPKDKSTKWSVRYSNLKTELEKLYTFADITIKTTINHTTKKIDIDIIGVDETLEGLNPVTFSSDFNNVQTQKWTNSTIDYKNVAYVAGQGEGKDRVIKLIGNDSGFSRREIFVDARDVSDNSLLEDRGNQTLADYPIISSLEGDVIGGQPFIYRKDWDLGSRVTFLSKDWGIKKEVIITSIIESFDTQGYNIKIGFGKSPINLTRKIKGTFNLLDKATTT